MRKDSALSRLEWIALALVVGGMIGPLVPYAVFG